MNIIFVNLPRYFDFISILLKRLKFQVYYISLTNEYSDTSESCRKRANSLKKNNIMPLPIDTIRDFPYHNFLPETYKKIKEESNKMLDEKLINKFSKFFKNIDNFEKKIKNNFITIMYEIYFPIMGRALVWAEKNPNKNNIFICFSFKYFFVKKCFKNKNMKIFVFPIKDLIKLFTFTFVQFFKLLKKLLIFKKKTNIIDTSTNFYDERVALIVHMARTHGNLFKKDIYYSKDENSFLNEKKLLHFNYLGKSKPPANIKWLNLITLGVEKREIIVKTVKAIFLSLPFAINKKKLLGLIFLTQTYFKYLIYYKKMKNFYNLKLVLVDYDTLCPKTLLFALESLSIKTLCAQDRFSLPLYNTGNFFYDYYLCSSDYVKEKIKTGERHVVKKIFTIGQPRVDNFLFSEKRRELRNVILSKGNFKKIITCFGFFTEIDWFVAKTSRVINWNSHLSFMQDILNLSKQNPDAYFILRYKKIDWLHIDFFKDILLEIKKAKNIKISNDYSKYDISYHLCSSSDLIIAKFTSIMEECLSLGFPVLVHDYSYNLNKILSSWIDYKPLDIICSNFDELSNKTKKILQISQDQFENENKEGLNKYFLRTKKPDVKNKIQLIVNEVYKELNV